MIKVLAFSERSLQPLGCERCSPRAIKLFVGNINDVAEAVLPANCYWADFITPGATKAVVGEVMPPPIAAAQLTAFSDSLRS